MEYRILGSLEATSNGHRIDLGPPKQRSLLALFLLSAERVVSVDSIVDALWGEDPPPSAPHSVQVYVSNLRQALRPDVIETRPPGYLLHLGGDELDSDHFETLINRASQTLADGRAGDALELATEALTLWHGPALSEFRYDDFARSEAERLEGLHLLAEELSCRALIELDRAPEALPRLRGLAAAQPLHDGYTELLMLALAKVGNSAEALGLYQHHRRRLAEELGIEPGAMLEDLEGRILAADESVAPGRSALQNTLPTEPLLIHNPYRGLRPFDHQDAANFFGRDRLLDVLVEALGGHHRMLGVVGPSGSGKSSVVRAGLIPRLRSMPGSARLLCAVMAPGAHPFVELEAALLRAATDPPAGLAELFENGEKGILRAVRRVLPDERSELLLVIDQLEELFTLVTDESLRTRFLHNLLAALEDPHCRLRVVATLRADFYDRPLLYPEFGAAFTANIVNVMPFSPDEYQAAATGPAANVGITLEPSLVTALVSDVVAQPGGLPLFEYTLTELFDARDGPILTLDAYRQMGGLEGTLAGRAEAAFAALDESGREAAHQLMLRLVAVGPEGEATRRRRPWSELASLGLDRIDDVVNTFGRLGLLTFDLDARRNERSIEISHDALLQEWPRLAEAIEESRADLTRHFALQAAVREWEEAGENEDWLLSGGRLDQFQDWREHASIRLTSTETRFLEESAAQEDILGSILRAERRSLERTARNRMLTLIGVLLVALVAAAALVIRGMSADDLRIAILHEGGDDEFAVHSLAGAQRASRDFDVPFDAITAFTGYEETLRDAVGTGYDLIVMTSAGFAPALGQVANEYPNVVFAIQDAEVDLPNVVSILYSDEEGSYLAGAAAALTSETGTIGFVGGLPWELIERFRAGYEAGARAVDPDVEILTTWLTIEFDILTAFNRPDLGRLAAAAQFDGGADVVYHAAGASGLGVFQAAAEASTPERMLWAIGVDVDQYVTLPHDLRPHVLTSMLKRLDLGVYEAIEAAVAGDLASGVVIHDLSNGGVSLAASGGLTSERRAIVDEMAAAVASGEVAVPDVPQAPNLVPLRPGAATAQASLTFDGDACQLEGPSSIGTSDILEISITNAGDAVTVFAVFATAQPGTPELSKLPPEVLPAWALAEESHAPIALGPGVTAPLFLEPDATGYAAYCWNGEWMEPGGFISVAGP